MDNSVQVCGIAHQHSLRWKTSPRGELPGQLPALLCAGTLSHYHNCMALIAVKQKVVVTVNINLDQCLMLPPDAF